LLTFKRKAREKTTRLLGYRTQYLHYSCKKPRATLVCFHGWLDNAASFTPLAEALADFEIYAWDFLGHGKSEHRHAGERYHYIDLVPFIDAALAAVHADKKILVGHSMGAGACALYAGAAGKNLGKLILIEGFAPMTAEPDDAVKNLAEGIEDFKKAQNLPKPRYENFADAVKVRMRINGLSEETALPLVKRATVKTSTGFTWRADFRLRAPSLVRMTQPQVKNILSQIAIPTLVILGEKGMPQLRAAAEKKADFFPHAQIEILPGHHHLHMDNAAAVAHTIDKFIG
jgi:pimeloyl-ACP methyl ester carboxylesterase